MIKTKEILLSALKLHKQGKINEAKTLYKKIIDIDPNNDSAWAFLSIIAHDNGNLDEALTCIQKAVEINPIPDYYKDLGNTFFDKKLYSQSIESFKKALELAPDFSEARFNLGYASFHYAEELRLSNNSEQAIKYYQMALEVSPDFTEAYFKLGMVFQNAGRFNEAVNSYCKTLELSPNSPNVYYNLGNLFLNIYEYEKACECFKKTLLLAPDNNNALNNLATSLYSLRRVDEAIEIYKKLLKISPEDPLIKLNLACAYLISKKFDEGWKLYESRFDIDHELRPVLRKFSKPRWNGDSIEGKTLYIYHEQGFGDTINFCRYLPVLKSMGAKVLFRPQPALMPLFRINDFGVEIIPPEVKDEDLNFDMYTPLLSILNFLNVNADNVITNKKYISADPEKVKVYREKYFNNDNFKVGIVWQSSLANNNRTSALKYFSPLANIENIRLYSLQKGSGTEQLNDSPFEITDLGTSFNDFSDTAAAVENLDLVISVDTALPHLAGALGKPVWTLLPFLSDFRWFIHEETTIWYESMRLFRQNEPNNWEEVLTRVAESLKKMLH